MHINNQFKFSTSFWNIIDMMQLQKKSYQNHVLFLQHDKEKRPIYYWGSQVT